MAAKSRFSSVNRRSVDALGFWPCAQLVTARGENPVKRVKVSCILGYGVGFAELSHRSAGLRAFL